MFVIPVFRMRTTIICLCAISVLCTAQQNGDAPFTLVDTRSPGSNSVTLNCRRTSTGLFDPQALYFRNGVRLDTTEGFLNTNNDPGVLSFLMTRKLEGEYSCGTQLERSDSTSFVGKPSVNL